VSMDEQQAWSKSDWEDESEDFVNSNERQVSFLLFFVLLALSRARSRQPTNASPAAHRRRLEHVGSGQQVRLLTLRCSSERVPRGWEGGKKTWSQFSRFFPFSLSSFFLSAPLILSSRTNGHDETKQETLRDGLNNVRERGRATGVANSTIARSLAFSLARSLSQKLLDLLQPFSLLFLSLPSPGPQPHAPLLARRRGDAEPAAFGVFLGPCSSSPSSPSGGGEQQQELRPLVPQQDADEGFDASPRPADLLAVFRGLRSCLGCHGCCNFVAFPRGQEEARTRRRRCSSRSKRLFEPGEENKCFFVVVGAAPLSSSALASAPRAALAVLVGGWAQVHSHVGGCC